jgi:hypothetical protein
VLTITPASSGGSVTAFSNTAAVAGSVNKPSVVYWSVRTADKAAPANVAEMKSTTNANDLTHASIDLTNTTSGGQIPISITGLSSSTNYVVYISAEDVSGNDSTITSLPFSTSKSTQTYAVTADDTADTTGNATLKLTLKPAGADILKAANIYVLASLGNQWYMHTSSGWTNLVWPLAPYSSVNALSDTNTFAVLSAADPARFKASDLSGVKVYIAYLAAGNLQFTGADQPAAYTFK